MDIIESCNSYLEIYDVSDSSDDEDKQNIRIITTMYSFKP